MENKVSEKMFYGAVDIVLSGGLAGGLGAVTAACFKSLCVTVPSAAIFCATAASITAITNLALTIFLQPPHRAHMQKFTIMLVSSVVGLTVAFGVTAACGVPISLAAGLGLTLTCLAAVGVVSVALISVGVLFATFAASAASNRRIV